MRYVRYARGWYAYGARTVVPIPGASCPARHGSGTAYMHMHMHMCTHAHAQVMWMSNMSTQVLTTLRQAVDRALVALK